MEELAMKGFNTGDGYMGMVDGEYILFASEADYYDYVNDQKSRQNFQKNKELWNLFPTHVLY